MQKRRVWGIWQPVVTLWVVSGVTAPKSDQSATPPTPVLWIEGYGPQPWAVCTTCNTDETFVRPSLICTTKIIDTGRHRGPSRAQSLHLLIWFGRLLGGEPLGLPSTSIIWTFFKQVITSNYPWNWQKSKGRLILIRSIQKTSYLDNRTWSIWHWKMKVMQVELSHPYLVTSVTWGDNYCCGAFQRMLTLNSNDVP